MIKAKVLSDSSSFSRFTRLITVETLAPKFLDAQVEKHRMISSNSSSDRAIPIEKMTFYLPSDLRVAQKGMQGDERVDAKTLYNFLEDYKDALDFLKGIAYTWSKIIHKQHLNRLLLGFSMQHKVMTATRENWEYFFSLRCASDADPAIQELANKIRCAISNSATTLMHNGDWHLPYADKDASLEDRIVQSVARCARVSYKNHDGSESSMDKDRKLVQFLKENRHLTPFEHQAYPMMIQDINGKWEEGVTHINRDNVPYSGNFPNWIQYRQIL